MQHLYESKSCVNCSQQLLRLGPSEPHEGPWHSEAIPNLLTWRQSYKTACFTVLKLHPPLKMSSPPNNRSAFPSLQA